MMEDACEPTVFVVDDDPSVRRSLRRTIESAGHRCEEFGSAGEFLKADCAEQPGCLVLDINLPGLNGLELQKLLVTAPCPLPIIFITGAGDIPMSVQAMKAGAIDFLPKPFRRKEILDAIGLALDRNRLERQNQRIRELIESRLAKLTHREREVMELVTKGLLNKQIAAKLGISEPTIKIHRGRVMHKMGVQSVAELVQICERVK